MNMQPALKNSALLFIVFIFCMTIVVYGAWRITSSSNQQQVVSQTGYLLDETTVAVERAVMEKLKVQLVPTKIVDQYDLYLDSQGKTISSLTLRFHANTQEPTQKVKLTLVPEFTEKGWQTILNSTTQKTEESIGPDITFEFAMLTLEPNGGSVFSADKPLAQITLNQSDVIVLNEPASKAVTQEGKQFGLELQAQLQ
jgi:hypothetical protein